MDSPDVNPVETMWRIIERDIYAKGKFYANENMFYHHIKSATNYRVINSQWHYEFQKDGIDKTK